MLQKFKNWYNNPNRAPITLRNIWAILQSWYRRNELDIPLHITEQAEWRLTQVNPACKESGTCIKCGCDVEGKVWEDRPCSGNCYPPMMGKSTWETFKKTL